MTAPPPPVRVTCHGIGTVSKPQPQHESGSESDFELDSPPHLTKIEVQEWDTTPISPSVSRLSDTPPPSPSSPIDIGQEWDITPISPSASPFGDTPPPSPPSPIDIGPAVLPTFCSHTEDYHSLDNHHSSQKYKEEGNQRQSDEFADSALEHYNEDENNKVKYELISSITSCGILDSKGCFGHVNFTAKGNQKNSKEELFFAELRFNDDSYITTCVLSLDGVKTIGGLCGSKYDNGKNGFCIDAKHCYACGRGLKHPKDGALYETGHVANSNYYHG